MPTPRSRTITLSVKNVCAHLTHRLNVGAENEQYTPQFKNKSEDNRKVVSGKMEDGCTTTTTWPTNLPICHPDNILWFVFTGRERRFFFSNQSSTSLGTSCFKVALQGQIILLTHKHTCAVKKKTKKTGNVYLILKLNWSQFLNKSSMTYLHN